MLSFRRATSLSPGIKAQLPILGEVFLLQKRNASSYEHHLKYGQGGRNSFNGNVVTVFGGTGFLGRYVINRLAKSGAQLVVPFRGSEDDVRHIRLMGDLGQIVFLPVDIHDYDSITRCLSHSNIAINLIGRNYSNRNFTIQDTSIGAAESIAKAASECGVKQLIHVSHICAGGNSPSEFMQAKALGERVVTGAFPTATIMKPAEAYGDEDRYLNKYAYLRKLPLGVPLVGGGWDTIKRPVFIADVAHAIVRATLDETSIGKAYELYGPEAYYLHDLVDYTFRMIRKPWRAIPVPIQIYKIWGWLGEQSLFPPKLTQDLVVRQFLTEDVTDNAYTFEDLGVTPCNINEAALTVLRRHRDYYNFEHVKDEVDVCKPITAYQ